MIRRRLDEWVAHWAEKQPGRPFMVCGDARVTYAEAEQVLRARAAVLAALPPVIAVRAAPRPEGVLDALACFRAGRAVVWLPPELAPEEEAALVAIGGARARLDAGALHEFGEAGDDDGARRWPTTEGALAFCSSGSTGEPRLALRSCESLADEGLRYREQAALEPGDCVAAALPIAHAFAFGACIAAGSVAGATLAFTPPTTTRALISALAQHRVACLPMVRALAAAMAIAGPGHKALRLRRAIVGAGPADASLSQRFEERWGLPISRNYGSSETGALLATVGFDGGAGTGRPMPGVECRLAGAREGAGQLWVRCAAPPLGELTRQGHDWTRLAPDGFWGTRDIFRTTESGGYLFAGRAERILRRGGHTISPAELERCIAEHPAVDDVVVVGEPSGSGETEIVAYVGAKAGVEPTALREWLNPKLAPSKHPTRWVVAAELARTWSGKALPRTAPEPSAEIVSDGGLKIEGLEAGAAAYRASAAIFATERLGLFALLENAVDPADLARAANVDESALRLLLSALETAKIVILDGGRYRLRRATASWRGPFLRLESTLAESWLSPAAIEQVVRDGLAARSFEQTGPEREIVDAYCAALAGPPQRSLAALLLRDCRASAGSVWEIGRAIGLASSVLCERHPGLRAKLSPIGPGAPAVAFAPPRSDVDEPLPIELVTPPLKPCAAVILWNAFHWLNPEWAPVFVARALDSLRSDGHLVVVDTFLQVTPRSPKALWVLDWMTHGGVHFQHIDDVAAVLQRACGVKPHVRRIEGFDFVALSISAAESKRRSVGHERNEGEAEVGRREGAAP